MKDFESWVARNAARIGVSAEDQERLSTTQRLLAKKKKWKKGEKRSTAARCGPPESAEHSSPHYRYDCDKEKP